MNIEPLNPVVCDNCGRMVDQDDALPPEFTNLGWWCRECADADMDTFFERNLDLQSRMSAQSTPEKEGEK